MTLAWHDPFVLVAVIVGALLVGISKTGVAGLGILIAAIFANLMPARQATGFVLPMLIFGDFIAVATYRQHADWRQVLRLLPWTAPGILAGYLALGWLSDRQARVLIGLLILSLIFWQLLRRLKGASGTTVEARGGRWSVACLGLGAGFTTLVANAAGPLMTLYLLAQRLPKLQFVGTAAVFFMLVNIFKVPFMVHLGLIDLESLKGNLLLLPAVGLGAWLGAVLLRKLPQKRFEQVALVLSAVAGVRLLF